MLIRFFFGYTAHCYPSSRLGIYQRLFRYRKWIWKLIRQLRRLVVHELQVCLGLPMRLHASPLQALALRQGHLFNILQKEALYPPSL